MLRHFLIGLQCLFILLLASTEGQLMKLYFRARMRAGRFVALDKLGFKVKPIHALPFDITGKPKADLHPNTQYKARKSRFMTIEKYPDASQGRLFGYKNPPVSGNVINGHNEADVRRPTKVFHSASYDIYLGGLERFFHTIAPWRTLIVVLLARWQDRRRIGPVAKRQIAVTDPAAMAEAIKADALALGAVKVGITPIPDHVKFQGVDVPFENAIVVASPMPLDDMRTCPSQKSDFAVQKGYRDAAWVGIKIAERLRKMGWDARVATNLGADTSEVQHIPLAIAAGIGELGKHNSIICKEHGSNIRLATVMTNMPLAYDRPIDIGVDDFCMSCQVCTTNCPPQAIFDTKQLVRGVNRWFIDVDKCAPYFAEHYSCGICITVCPWTQPGQGPLLSEKVLLQRERRQVSSVAG